MSEDSPITAFTTRKCPDKSYDSIPKINGQREYGPELDHDRVHFPERVAQRKMEESFANSQVRGGTDWQKLGHTFNNPENDRQKKIVHDIGIGYRLFVISYQLSVIRCQLSCCRGSTFYAASVLRPLAPRPVVLLSCCPVVLLSCCPVVP